MKSLALVGLVVSLVLGAIAVSSTNDEVHARQNAQDASLLGAVSTESGLISEGERQTTTALSLMLVNPAVRGLLSAGPTTGPAARPESARRRARAHDDPQDRVRPRQRRLPGRRQRAPARVLAARAHARVLSEARRQFVALAAGSAVGAASGAFFSPVSHQLSVAFLAPFRVGGRLLGVVHLDISVANTRGSRLIDQRHARRRSEPGGL